MRGEEHGFEVDPAEWERSYDSAGGEKSLLAAILIRALADLNMGGESSRSAIRFFLSEDDDHVCSFRSICSFLALEPDRILRFAKETAKASSKIVTRSSVLHFR